MNRTHLSASIAAVCIFFSGFTGCIYSKIHPAGIEPSSKVVKDLPYEVLGTAQGSSSSFALLWALPVTPKAAIDEAVNEAVRAKGGDNLIEVKMWKERSIWLLGTVESIHVKGKVIRYTAQ